MGKYEYVSEFSKFFDIENAGLILLSHCLILGPN